MATRGQLTEDSVAKCGAYSGSSYCFLLWRCLNGKLNLNGDLVEKF